LLQILLGVTKCVFIGYLNVQPVYRGCNICGRFVCTVDTSVYMLSQKMRSIAIQSSTPVDVISGCYAEKMPGWPRVWKTWKCRDSAKS